MWGLPTWKGHSQGHPHQQMPLCVHTRHVLFLIRCILHWFWIDRWVKNKLHEWKHLCVGLTCLSASVWFKPAFCCSLILLLPLEFSCLPACILGEPAQGAKPGKNTLYSLCCCVGFRLLSTWTGLSRGQSKKRWWPVHHCFRLEAQLTLSCLSYCCYIAFSFHQNIPLT